MFEEKKTPFLELKSHKQLPDVVIGLGRIKQTGFELSIYPETAKSNQVSPNCYVESGMSNQVGYQPANTFNDDNGASRYA